MGRYHIMNSTFVSELDQFLTVCDEKQRQFSESQREEIAKHQRITRLREHAESEQRIQSLWQGF